MSIKNVSDCFECYFYDIIDSVPLIVALNDGVMYI